MREQLEAADVQAGERGDRVAGIQVRKGGVDELFVPHQKTTEDCDHGWPWPC